MAPRLFEGSGHHFLMSHRSFVWLCLLPLAVVTVAFFLLPITRLVVTGADGPQGIAGYLAILTEPRYRATLINTVLLAVATTVVTLIVATIAGMFLQRHRFPGRAVLIAMLTFPLAFPGVVVGFMIILLAGRQGLIGDISNRLVGRSSCSPIRSTDCSSATSISPFPASSSPSWLRCRSSTLAVTLLVGVPSAYALHVRGGQLSRIVEGDHHAAACDPRPCDRAGPAADLWQLRWFPSLMAVHPRRPRRVHDALHGALGDGRFRHRRYQDAR